MKAWLLGSGGWIPTGTRETTCLLVRNGASALVVDLGTGARRLVTDPALLDGAELRYSAVYGFCMMGAVGVPLLWTLTWRREPLREPA